MLACRTIITWPHKGWAIYFWVDDVDALASELKQPGTRLKCCPTIKVYDCKEIEIMSPDGRDIVFEQITA